MKTLGPAQIIFVIACAVGFVLAAFSLATQGLTLLGVYGVVAYPLVILLLWRRWRRPPT